MTSVSRPRRKALLPASGARPAPADGSARASGARRANSTRVTRSLLPARGACRGGGFTATRAAGTIVVGGPPSGTDSAASKAPHSRWRFGADPRTAPGRAGSTIIGASWLEIPAGLEGVFLAASRPLLAHGRIRNLPREGTGLPGSRPGSRRVSRMRLSTVRIRSRSHHNGDRWLPPPASARWFHATCAPCGDERPDDSHRLRAKSA